MHLSGRQLSRRTAIQLVAMNAVAGAAAVSAQLQSTTPTGQAPQKPTGPLGLGDEPGVGREPQNPMGERMRITAEKAHNDDRRKRMLSDTDKLLALSTELKADIEKCTMDELSLEVIRKAQEIEKLAHDVQQRMKN